MMLGTNELVGELIVISFDERISLAGSRLCDY